MAIVPSNNPTTAAARKAVSRLICSQGRRLITAKRGDDSARSSRLAPTIVWMSTLDSCSMADTMAECLITPDEAAIDIDHGQFGDRLLLQHRDEFRARVEVLHGRDQAARDVAQRKLGVRRGEVLDFDAAAQLSLVIDDKEFPQPVPANALEAGERLADARALAQRRDMRIHEAAGRILRIGEQVAQLLGDRRVRERQQARSLVVVELRERSCRNRGFGFLQPMPRGLGCDRLQRGRGDVGGQRLPYRQRDVRRQRLEQRCGVLRRDLLELAGGLPRIVEQEATAQCGDRRDRSSASWPGPRRGEQRDASLRSRPDTLCQ